MENLCDQICKQLIRTVTILLFSSRNIFINKSHTRIFGVHFCQKVQSETNKAKEESNLYLQQNNKNIQEGRKCNSSPCFIESLYIQRSGPRFARNKVKFYYTAILKQQQQNKLSCLLLMKASVLVPISKQRNSGCLCTCPLKHAWPIAGTRRWISRRVCAGQCWFKLFLITECSSVSISLVWHTIYIVKKPQIVHFSYWELGGRNTSFAYFLNKKNEATAKHGCRGPAQNP